jgi:CheY-like chemotaxis protein
MRESSECRNLEEDIPEAEKIRPNDELAEMLVRDISNILTAISAYSTMLFEDLPPGPQRELVSEIQRAGEQGSELVRRLRESSRGETITPALVRGGETILLVEDEDDVRCIAGRVLRASGYTVVEARTGEEALAVLERRDPIHMVLTDMVLPGMSGRELVRDLAVRRPQVRTLLMSGYPLEAESSSGALRPQVNHMMKPFTVAILEAKVREVLDAE